MALWKPQLLLSVIREVEVNRGAPADDTVDTTERGGVVGAHYAVGGNSVLRATINSTNRALQLKTFEVVADLPE